ncbi:MAG: AbgT family transporter, partial [Oscillospiraceae bacterium]
MKSKKNLFQKFLNRIELLGNKLPHPITLFFIFCLTIIIISAICEYFGLSVTGEIINRQTNKVELQTISVVSLLSREGLQHCLTKAITNFTNFVPLGVVLVSMLGVGIADGSGYIAAILKRTIGVTPKALITPMVVFLGIMSNVAADAGYVVLIPLGALMFMSVGRHPIAGIAAAFAGVSGGFSANLIITTLDPMLAGLSTEAAHILDPNYTVLPTANLYFMIASTVLVTIIGTFVTQKIIEPRLGSYK